MIYKILNGALYTTDKYGNTLRKICEGVSYGAYDDTQNIFLITKVNGIVETRDINGNHLRMICDGCIEARFSGTDILIRRKDGRNELRDRFGNQLRYI
jgi:hypothetical protein